eukprot:s1629_g11.t1
MPMWKPVPKATDLGPAWPKGYWEAPFHQRSDVRPDPRAVQHRLQAAHQEINQRHQGDRYEVEIRQVLEGQDSNTQANVLAALAPMELHEKLAVVEVLGSMPTSLKTSLLMQGNDMSLWDRIAMFHGWAKRRQRGLDVVPEFHERPGIAGLPDTLAVIGLALLVIYAVIGLAIQDTLVVINLGIKDSLVVIKWATERIFKVIGPLKMPTSTTMIYGMEIGSDNMLTMDSEMMDLDVINAADRGRPKRH